MANSVMRADYLKNSTPERVAQIRSTDTTTNLNASTAYAVVPLAGIADEMDTGFSIGTNGIICNFTGRVFAHGAIKIFSTVARSNIVIKLAINGVEQPTQGSGTYIRNAVGQQESSTAVGQWLDVVAGEEVTILSKREAASGTVTMTSLASVLHLRRPAVVDAFPSNPTALALIWAEENSTIQNNTFDYSFGNGQTGNSTDGLVLHRPGRILSLSFQARSGTALAEVEVTLNGISSGANLVVPINALKNSITFPVPIVFSTQDTLNFRTISAGGRANVVVCAEVVYDF